MKVMGDRRYGKLWSTSALGTIRDRERWAKLQSVAMVRSERTVAGETSIETRFYLSSATSNAERLANAIRAHWGVENQVH
jgi:predicted transposase YbfD/YdcC